MFCCDGEPAELAAGSIGRTKLPSLLTVWRCALHSGQKSLETALKTDSKVEALVQELVTRFSEPNQLGSLARAVSSSTRLRFHFSAVESRDLDALSELAILARSASTEFRRVRFEVWAQFNLGNFKVFVI